MVPASTEEELTPIKMNWKLETSFEGNWGYGGIFIQNLGDGVVTRWAAKRYLPDSRIGERRKANGWSRDYMYAAATLFGNEVQGTRTAHARLMDDTVGTRFIWEPRGLYDVQYFISQPEFKQVSIFERMGMTRAAATHIDFVHGLDLVDRDNLPRNMIIQEGSEGQSIEERILSIDFGLSCNIDQVKHEPPGFGSPLTMPWNVVHRDSRFHYTPQDDVAQVTAMGIRFVTGKWYHEPVMEELGIDPRVYEQEAIPIDDSSQRLRERLKDLSREEHETLRRKSLDMIPRDMKFEDLEAAFFDGLAYLPEERPNPQEFLGAMDKAIKFADTGIHQYYEVNSLRRSNEIIQEKLQQEKEAGRNSLLVVTGLAAIAIGGASFFFSLDTTPEVPTTAISQRAATDVSHVPEIDDGSLRKSSYIIPEDSVLFQLILQYERATNHLYAEDGVYPSFDSLRDYERFYNPSERNRFNQQQLGIYKRLDGFKNVGKHNVRPNHDQAAYKILKAAMTEAIDNELLCLQPGQQIDVDRLALRSVVGSMLADNAFRATQHIEHPTMQDYLEVNRTTDPLIRAEYHDLLQLWPALLAGQKLPSFEYLPKESDLCRQEGRWIDHYREIM
ncbi:MAG: hypothetical protein OXR66_06150 [Candidatus Woesearchaeota archaeon]|nr:hypothetical protein [Candidatus Woesearchaeota archaeon]